MNRKQFIRNIIGATAAVVIGKKLPVPKTAIGIDPYHPGIGGKAFVLKLEDSWMKQAEAEYMRKWMRDNEMVIWQGSPISSES